MDTQFDWLGSFAASSSSKSPNRSGPPVVSFGSGPGSVPGSGSPHKTHTNPMKSPQTPPVFSQITDHESVPLSLQAHELTLEESKTYMRWYSDILARTNSRTIAISDVYQFLGNFKISDQTKAHINRIFGKILSSINIGEFFALLRVVSHALQGSDPARALIKIPTTVPVPPSILSKKRLKDDQDDYSSGGDETPAESPAPSPAAPLDLDSFTQFMLTGERPGERSTKKKSKKLKSVKFSDQVVSDIQHTYQPTESPQGADATLDYSLPMDQLLSRMNASVSNSGSNAQYSQNSETSLAVPSYDNRITSPDPEEKQILRDMEPQMNHFRNLHSVDTISVDGVPSNIHLQENSDFGSPRRASPQPPLLKPNMTGPAQMASMGLNTSSPDLTQPLRPNVTGPADMARLFAPTDSGSSKVSLQAFTSQMTGDTLDNTAQNAMIGQSATMHQNGSASTTGPHPPPPPPVPSIRRARSVSQPSPLNHTWTSTQTLAESDRYNADTSSNGSVADRSFLHPNFSSDQSRQAPSVPSRSPPVPPRSPLGHGQGQGQPQSQRLRPPPPPPSRRISSASPTFASSQSPPPLPAKVPNEPVYQASQGSSSTTNILDDLKALQEEVDRIRDLTGGF
ncbi:hypothetical protein JCM33374_g4233 [Metschnikowia sp. JCM 33374]|nr:hypothetical protein JCM33374_g4233 [Metschnikowia sp. JCM 33374]